MACPATGPKQPHEGTGAVQVGSGDQQLHVACPHALHAACSRRNIKPGKQPVQPVRVLVCATWWNVVIMCPRHQLAVECICATSLTSVLTFECVWMLLEQTGFSCAMRLLCAVAQVVSAWTLTLLVSRSKEAGRWTMMLVQRCRMQ